jgi:hypothetical protein
MNSNLDEADRQLSLGHNQILKESGCPLCGRLLPPKILHCPGCGSCQPGHWHFEGKVEYED